MMTYFVRFVLTSFFVRQKEAEKTRDSLTKILANLPDAVLTFESGKLTYINQQVDTFFGVSLSHVPLTDILGKSAYLITKNRCFHELKTSRVKKVAEKMVQEEEGSNRSICLTDLGSNVLTLDEVMQTFEKESPMFNIKNRTVILTKNEVQIDGK